MQCAVCGAPACRLRGCSSKRQQRGCTKAGMEGAPAIALRCIWAGVGETFPRRYSRPFRAQAGAAFSLRDRRLQAVAPPSPADGAAAAWKVTADDELMNEDELLTEEDLQRPVKAPGADDCEVRLGCSLSRGSHRCLSLAHATFMRRWARAAAKLAPTARAGAQRARSRLTPAATPRCLLLHAETCATSAAPARPSDLTPTRAVLPWRRVSLRLVPLPRQTGLQARRKGAAVCRRRGPVTMNTHVRSKALRPLLRDQMVHVNLTLLSFSLRWSNDIRKPDAPLHVVAMLQLMLQAAPRAARCVACKRFVSNAAGRRMRRSATATQAHGQPAAVAPPSAVDEWEGLRGWRAAGVNTNRRRVASRPPRVAARGLCRAAARRQAPTRIVLLHAASARGVDTFSLRAGGA